MPTALDCLRLYRTENVGPVTYRQLLKRYGTPSDALKALPELAARGGRKKPLIIPKDKDIEKERAAGQKLGAALVTHLDQDYSPTLWACEDAPPLLWVLGHRHLLNKPALAIVGARNTSANGLRLAQSMAQELSDNGIIIVSGMARGADGAAHAGALQGKASTIAVLAGGLDHIYPQEHIDLYHAIKDRGALVTEMPPGTIAQARHFPRRNRIISGLSLGTLVIEAAKRSGSLITARFAAEQGRQVYAIPGHPMDARAGGPNDLIRQGATLVQSAQDILQDLRPMLDTPLEEPDMPYTPATTAPLSESELNTARPDVLALLGPTPTLLDDVIRQSGHAPGLVHTIILELELAGRIQRQAGQKVSLTTMDEGRGQTNDASLRHQHSLF